MFIKFNIKIMHYLLFSIHYGEAFSKLQSQQLAGMSH